MRLDFETWSMNRWDRRGAVPENFNLDPNLLYQGQVLKKVQTITLEPFVIMTWKL